jgi:hypothetical protein
MSAKNGLAEQFAEVQGVLAEATRTHDRIRSEYFADRRKRAKAGEDLEPLECHDSTVWQEQLNRESIARENGELDRKAGLAA